ncbi:hypothetical protein AN2V17_01800 [Vallitalea sp. AN17-2]|uniref:Uncharacterized protein n=1 Tax=Vallitalea maricola TaxID=3074433 RepID=A0ACB5UEK8_9FIRM|nr:hypothetical protein AN2V17_01800 [Vallitalea sp. AN17-2]
MILSEPQYNNYQRINENEKKHLRYIRNTIVKGYKIKKFVQRYNKCQGINYQTTFETKQ